MSPPSVCTFYPRAFGALALTAPLLRPSDAQTKTVMVGGAAMFQSKTSSRNAVHSRITPTMVRRLIGRRLVETGKAGPVTVFAPDHTSFRKAAGRQGRHAGEAREQADSDQKIPDLSCRARQTEAST